MSAQNPQSGGVITAIAGMLGFSVLAGLLVAVMVTPTVAVTSVTASNTIGIFDSLPEYLKIGDQPQQNEIIAYSDGTPVVIATVYDQNREEVQWDQVSDYLKDATIAGEDRRFYEHGGVDLQGVIRVVVKNVAGSDGGGASTLSMQLVKNIFIQQALKKDTLAAQKAAIKAAQEITLDRKLKEMKYAIGIEKEYTKDEILLAYLNIAGFGGNTYGIEAAAERYYGVSAADVTIAQAASLLAIVQEPGARSLDKPANYAANKERRNVILGNMRVEGMITQAELEEARAVPVDETTVHLGTLNNGCVAANPYAKQFCDYIVRSVKDLAPLGATEAERKENWKIGGFKVYTTLDLVLQTVAQNALQKYAPNTETRLQLGASSTSVQVGTGRILTMAQNKDFDNTLAGGGPTTSAINFNTDFLYGGSSGFQVGSTYKVFTLLNWLESGRGVNEVVNVNSRLVQLSAFTDSCNGPYGGTWKPRNDSNESGSRTVLQTTANSINGGYVSMALQLDLCNTKKIAERLGVHTAVPFDNPKTTGVGNDESSLESNPATILGVKDIAPLTIAAAYAGVASGGTYCKPIAVDKIVNAKGEDLGGQTPECTTALDPEVAAAAIFVLKKGMASYGANPRDGTPMFGKTGTTDASKQTYVTASSSTVTTVVWVGNITGNYPMRKYPSGGTLRHTIGRIILAAANQRYPGSEFTAPPARLLTGAGVTVDDVIGQTPELAKSIIEARGLEFADGGVVDSDLPIGQVAKTDPGAGTVVSKGTTVTVYTSNGSMSALPDVVSGHNDYNSAKSTLNAAGFMTVNQSCVVVPPGDSNLNKVISSDPTPGTVVPRTASVKLGVGQVACP